MSEYADLCIKKLNLCTFRNYLDEDIVNMFFSKRDLSVIPGCKYDPEDDSSEYTMYIYKTTVKQAKERFDARGFCVDRFEKIFNTNILESIDFHAFFPKLYMYDNDDEKRLQERIQKRVSFKKWKNAMKKIVTYELENGNIDYNGTISDIGIKTECEKAIYNSLKNDYSDSFYALNTEIIPIEYILRLILENCDCDEEIVLDFSNLVYWSEDSISDAISAAEKVEKIIVLVEGTSDKDILEFSMNKIYPHLCDLFYFMDFDDKSGGKRDGGTSYVVKNLKTFYFSKTKSKFIAIFDNDAEGYQSKCTLLTEIKNWPDNFRILLYPEINFFRSYPTLAPNGKVLADDINKKACSIELYLPDSIIKNNGEFYPIEWESRKNIKTTDGNEEALYQGVISKKDEIKKNFHKFRKRIEADENLFVAEDWIRMKRLLDTIVFAFAKS